jgi:hypothetical protein
MDRGRLLRRDFVIGGGFLRWLGCRSFVSGGGRLLRRYIFIGGEEGGAREIGSGENSMDFARLPQLPLRLDAGSGHSENQSQHRHRCHFSAWFKSLVGAFLSAPIAAYQYFLLSAIEHSPQRTLPCGAEQCANTQ